MSDVHVAPAGDAPAAAPVNEVVVNQNPTNTPAPVGSQAPDKPVAEIKGSEHRPQSKAEQRRADIDAAFKRADERSKQTPQQQQPRRETSQQQRPAAEAKPGHNNPPQEEKPQQHREQGRFARAPEQQLSQQGQQQVGQQGAQLAQQSRDQQQRQQLPPDANYREPPQRMSDASKADWGNTPETVRGEVYRMMRDFNGAYERYKQDHEAMNAIRPFHEMAQQQGTNLHTALNNYVSMEMKLREDLVGGLDVIVRNLGLKGEDGRPITLTDVAYHIMNMTPDQHRLTQAQNAQVAQRQQIGQLHQEITGLKTAVQQMHNQQRFSVSRESVEQFAASHPRFDELGPAIKAEIDLGFTLEQAYRRADLLYPATQAAQTRTTSAQTRPADRSISGAPSNAPSNGRAERKNGTPVTRRASVENAINAVLGGR